LNIIIKTDVDGSLEAILNVLETYTGENKVTLDLVHFEVGQLKKQDIELAETFDAIIYLFNLKPNPTLENTFLDKPSSEMTEAEKSKISRIRHFNVIYKLFDDLKFELNSRAPLVEQEDKLGEAEILKVGSFQRVYFY
jgi:translation initiation factor IF-2